MLSRHALGASFASLILLAGIAIGSLLGYLAPTTAQRVSDWVDPTLLALVALLFFGVRFGALLQALSDLRVLGLALLANFVLIPLIGYTVASLFLNAHPLFMVGLVIYFMSPCTDWFLGFTRLANGNVALGAALIPINMLVQLLLYPLYLQLFAGKAVEVEAEVIGGTLLQWFLQPLLVAVVAHLLSRLLLGGKRFAALLARIDQLVPWLIGLLVLEIFAGNIAVIFEHRGVFIWVLLAVFSFFVLTFLLGEGLSRLVGLDYPEHALLSMTTAARNAPLMLAVTMAALPDQPLVYAALVIGMLVEFPHLTALRWVLLSAQRRHVPARCLRTDRP
ncbi:arsenic resistance protein [Pseudomonas sp. LRF_L74]|uniref:arsenic resistance protein n=1 Tax=Pseudomonas sp. LRF_L74 TaxID=3369422 RepID=UPI003F620EE9